MRLRCPVCHAEAALEAWVEDEAARELFGLLAGLPAGLGRAMVQYLGLWRPAKRALAWDRALRIAREATALAAPEVLERAMVITIEAMRSKRDAGEVRPLDSHAYLVKVIESVAARGEAMPMPRIERTMPSSRTAQAMAGFLGVMPDGGA